MARTAATLPGGARLTDHMSITAVARIFPLGEVRHALRVSGCESRRRRSLPAEVMVYYVIAMALFRPVSTREVLRWWSPELALGVSGKSSISRARARLGTKPFEVLRCRCAGRLAGAGTPGAWYRGLRLVGFDGRTLNLPDEEANRRAFGLPASWRGSARARRRG